MYEYRKPSVSEAATHNQTYYSFCSETWIFTLSGITKDRSIWLGLCSQINLAKLKTKAKSRELWAFSRFLFWACRGAGGPLSCVGIRSARKCGAAAAWAQAEETAVRFYFCFLTWLYFTISAMSIHYFFVSIASWILMYSGKLNRGNIAPRTPRGSWHHGHASHFHT